MSEEGHAQLSKLREPGNHLSHVCFGFIPSLYSPLLCVCVCVCVCLYVSMRLCLCLCLCLCLRGVERSECLSPMQHTPEQLEALETLSMMGLQDSDGLGDDALRAEFLRLCHHLYEEVFPCFCVVRVVKSCRTHTIATQFLLSLREHSCAWYTVAFFA